MFRILTIIGLATLTVLPACATAKGTSYINTNYDLGRVDRIAVVDGNNPSYRPEIRQSLIDSFQLQFLKRGWNPVDRSNIQQAIDEMDFQGSDITASTNVRKIGSILNVSAVVIINIGSVGNEISISAKMLDVETGEIIWQGEGDGDIKAGTSGLLGALGGAAIGAVIGDSEGAIAGAIGGAALGTFLTPSELENAKKVVAAVCEMIPQR